MTAKGARGQTGPAPEGAAKAGLFGIAQSVGNFIDRHGCLAQIDASELLALLFDQVRETQAMGGKAALKGTDRKTQLFGASFHRTIARRQRPPDVAAGAFAHVRAVEYPQAGEIATKQPIDEAIGAGDRQVQHGGRKNDAVAFGTMADRRTDQTFDLE